jgi:hypothetical protein
MRQISKALGVAALLATTALGANAWAGSPTGPGITVPGGTNPCPPGLCGPPTVTVPEPGALELLVGGVAVGIAALRLRRRK